MASLTASSSSYTPDQIRLYDGFYNKLLSLRDDLYAGRHPRYRRPAELDQHLPGRASLPTPTVLPVLPMIGTAESHHSRKTHNQVSPLTGLASTSQPLASASLPSTTPAAASKPSSSGIDPVLLQKSDTLLQAELSMQRQRIERRLHDHIEHTKPHRDSAIDVDSVLKAAYGIVKPLSGLKSDSEGSASPGADVDSVDDYYSSKANSWSSENTDNALRARGADIKGKAALREDRVLDDGQSHRDANPAAIGGTHDISGNNHEQVAEDTPFARPEQPHTGDPLSAYDTMDEDPEDDYSPPPADETWRQAAAPFIAPSQPQTNQGVGPVIRNNNIDTPIAPQPSRVSPLVNLGQSQRSNEPSRFVHDRTQRPGGSGARDAFKNSARAKREHRKKEKREMRANRGNQGNQGTPRERSRSPPRSPVRSAPRSPDVYVKPEPESPPPFAGFANSQGDQRVLQDPGVEFTDDLDEGFNAPAQLYQLDPYDGSFRPVAVDPVVTSPASARPHSRLRPRAIGGEPDLRRIASYQYAKRAPQVQPSLQELRPTRSASHAFGSRLVEADDLPDAEQRPVYVMDRRATPSYPDQHFERAVASPRPSHSGRRVMVDEYGTRYYAAPEAAPGYDRGAADMYVERRRPGPQFDDDHPSLYPRLHETLADMEDRAAMPPPRIRRTVQPEGDPFRGAIRQRGFSQRPVDLVRDEDAHARTAMPPPQLARMSEQPHLDPRARSYRQRDYSMRPLDAPLREEVIREGVGRHQLAGGPVPPQRAFSVVPNPMARNDVAAGIRSRYASAQPGGPPAMRMPDDPMPPSPPSASRREPVHRYASVQREHHYTPPQPRREASMHRVVHAPGDDRQYDFPPRPAQYYEDYEVPPRRVPQPLVVTENDRVYYDGYYQ